MSDLMAVDDVTVEIGQLAGLHLNELRKRWRIVFRSDAPMRISREVLALALSYDLQVQAFGGPSPTALSWLVGNDGVPARSRNRRRVHNIKTGTRFIRSWQGRTVEAVARDDGQFDHNGKIWRSLSAIARYVTGTRWSGPAFFGISGGR